MNSILNRFCAIMLALFFAATVCWAQDTTKSERATSDTTATSDKTDKNTSDEAKRIEKSTTVLTQIMDAKDKSIPIDVLSKAKCVAIVPSMLKAGFVVGGRYGKGVATCRLASGRWSAPAPFTIAGGDWGLQIGGEAIDLVMLVMNEKGMRNLLASKFKIGADASAAAGPIGRHAEGSVDWKMDSELLTYSRAKGVFAGITLNGAVVKQDNDETRVLYGKMETFPNILTGKVPVPRGAAQEFVATVHKYASEAKEQKAERSSTTPTPAERQ
jgi:lipid-binding SYLF domain-containing protein